MKKKNILILAFLFLLVTACQKSDWEYDNLFPEEYEVVFSIKNALNVTHVISREDETSIYAVTVLKGGSQPALAADVAVEVWSSEEVEAYGDVLGTAYKLLPSDTYVLSDTELHFDGSVRGKDIMITFKPEKVEQCVGSNPEVIYVLPLRLISEETVDEAHKEVLITVSLTD